MLLPLMSVTVIPFLLGALVFVKNNDEWNFGPKYIFHLNKTTKVFMDAIVTERVTATIKCRPNVSQSVENVLFCDAHEVILSNYVTQQTYKYMMENNIVNYRNVSPNIVTREMPRRLFVLTFGTQGVQHFKVKGRELEPYFYDVIPDIIEQFNFGINLSIAAGNSMKNYEDIPRGTHVINSFTQTNEDTAKASKCNTSLIITYTPSNYSHENEEHQDHKNKTEFNFYPELLPISYTHAANTILTIKKIVTACTYQPGNIRLLNEKWGIDNMTQYYNVMELRSTKPVFSSGIHLEGYVSKPKSDRKHYFSEDVQFKLLYIKPAKSELYTPKYV